MLTDIILRPNTPEFMSVSKPIDPVAYGINNAGAVVGTSDFEGYGFLFSLGGVYVSQYTGNVSGAIWQNLKNAGWRYMVAQGFGGRGRNSHATLQLANARGVGLSTAVYCFLNFDNGSTLSGAPNNQTGGWQVQQSLVAVGTEAAYLSFLAIDVEVAYKGMMLSASRLARIREAILATRDAGLVPIIYTSRSGWNELTGNSTAADIAALPLWDARYGPPPPGEELASLTQDRDGAFRPYGGWTTRTGKQYGDNTRPTAQLLSQQFGIGVVDVNMFDPSLFAPRTPPLIPIVTLTKAKLNAGASTTGSILLSGSLPPGNVTITLINSAPAIVTVPGSITIPAGTRTATFPVTTRANQGGVFTIAASVNGIKTTATLTVFAPTPPPTYD